MRRGGACPKECPLLYTSYIISWLPQRLACSGPLPWASSLPASAGTGVYEPPARLHGPVRDLAIGQTIRIGVKIVSLPVEGCTCVVWSKGLNDMGFWLRRQQCTHTRSSFPTLPGITPSEAYSFVHHLSLFLNHHACMIVFSEHL